MKTQNFLYIILAAILVVSACTEEDDPEPISTTTDHKIFVTTILPNPDGMSGSQYIQLIEDLSEADVTNETAIPVAYNSIPVINGDDIFIGPGLGGVTDQIKKYNRDGGQLVENGAYTLPPQSGAMLSVVDGDNLYISCWNLGKIVVLNHNDMSFVEEIDVTSYAIGDQNPEPSAMVVRDDKLFVCLSQTVGGYFPDMTRIKADMLIINTADNTIDKMITDSISGMSYPGRPIDPNTMFIDENNDIYLICMGGFGMLPGHNAGILRIKDGETEFDDTYQFVFPTTAITGESNSMDFIHMIKYAGNGKMYATANIPALTSDPADWINDRNVLPVEIDIYSKSITALDLPYSNSFGICVGKYENDIVFGLSTADYDGFFTYNTNDQTTSSNALITTVGYPMFIYVFE